MVTSEKGIKLIKSFEGFRAVAYKAVSTEQYLTIGYGHYGADVQLGQTITEQEATLLMANDLKKYENKVNQYADKYKFNQNQFDAAVSFAYNCGVGNFDKLVDYGKRDIEQIRTAWLYYNKSGGKVLRGLTNRRKKELELFDSPVGTPVTLVDMNNYTAGKYKVTASALNVRIGVGTINGIIGKIKRDSIINITSISMRDNQLWGKLDNYNGYVCMVYNNAVYVEPYIESKIETCSLSSDADIQLSKNFKVKEFACKDGSDIVLIDMKLVHYLQLIRDHYNKPVKVNSGYRTLPYNLKVGGASKSYHMRGMAADISINGVTPREIAAYAESLGILGIGLYDSFTHIDTRTTKSFWYSSKQIKMNTFK